MKYQAIKHYDWSQVLPPSMLLLADTCPDALVAALEAALDRTPFVDRASQHKQAQPATANYLTQCIPRNPVANALVAVLGLLLICPLLLNAGPTSS